MPEIHLPAKSAANEFGAIGALYTLLAYCVHPMDDQKRNEMIQVKNIEVLHKIKYDLFDLEKHKDDLVPEKADEFWNEAEEFFGEAHKGSINTFRDSFTPRSFMEAIKPSMIQLAMDSLSLPDDIQRFLLHAPTPAHIDANRDKFLEGMGTAAAVLVKLIQMQKSIPNIRGGVSLNKAIELVESEGKAPLKNRTYITKAWNVYKKSVHIYLGFIFASYIVKNIPDIKTHCSETGYISPYFSPLFLGFIFIFSKVLQEWMLDIKSSPHAALDKKRLIKPTQLWLIPAKVKVPSSFKNMLEKFTPLEDWEITQLQKKRLRS